MKFAVGSMLFGAVIAAAAVQGLPTNEDTRGTAEAGCRVYMGQTNANPVNPASKIRSYTVLKWMMSNTTTHGMKMEWLDLTNTHQAPFDVTFKIGLIPGYQTAEKLHAVLDKWIGTYLIGDKEQKDDDFLIKSVTC
ncbi:hypothetical protein F5Y18DRAFT_438004 [Xylariaceae sp. FL1019]|nr:hypothetical protein F5Y18DRAFT_438004 [Xylariaceae sp. FL1019]